MITLVSANWLLFLIALLIGVATAFWAWASSGGENRATERFSSDDGLLDRAGEAVEPEPQPVTPRTTLKSDPEPAAPPTPAPEPVATAAKTGAAATATAAATKPKTPATPRPRRKPATEEKAAPPPPGKPKIAAAVGDPDNLRLIKGVGPKLNTMLNNLGVTRFDQIAAWKEVEIAEVDKYLENFSGRITRDNWIDQAKFLAKDDIAGFEKKYGKL